jgi:hypothetical protein
MDSELSSIANVKALDQSVVSGATPTFTTTNFTDASNKRLMTDAQETKLDSVESSADVTDATNVAAAGALMVSDITDSDAIKGINQDLTSTSAVAFSTVNTGQGANELYDMDQNVKTDSAVTFATVNTGQGANELYDMDQNVKTDSNVTFADITATGDLTVTGDVTQQQVTNINIEDQFILLHSGSAATADSGIIFGGTSGTAAQGKALVWDADYNGSDGRLAVSTTDVAWNSTSAYGAGTAGYYVAGVFEGSLADAATAKADHAGNIRIESSDIYIYV